MEEDGVLVGTGSFRVDREAALKKLAAFQLDDQELLTPWVRLAVARGASRFLVDTRNHRVTLGFDGRPLPPAAVKDPLGPLLGATQRRPEDVYLAAGYLGFSKAAEALELVSDADGTRLYGVAGREAALRKAVRALPGRLQWCPLSLRVDGEPVELGRPAGLQWTEKGTDFCVAASDTPWDEASRLRLCVHGVSAQTLERDTPWAAVDAFIRDNTLSLDASLARVVEDARMEGLVKRLGGRVRDFVRREALAQKAEAPALQRLLSAESYRDAWKGKPYRESGALMSLAERFMNVKPLSRESYELVLRARARVRWLRACCLGRLGEFQQDAKERTRRVLWTAPLFLHCRGGWVSLRDLACVRNRVGFVPLADSPGRGRDFAHGVRPAEVVWAIGNDDCDDLGRLFEGAVGRPR
ncbi:MAG: hypothetical protein HY928_12275 [Elusimicrobia bacterium]|nr:hypothetical protein [Elusimicrobiota bacterium]